MNIRKQVEEIQRIERNIEEYEYDLKEIRLHSTDLCSCTINGYVSLKDINNNYKKVIAHYIKKKIRQLKKKKEKLELKLKSI